MPYRQFIDPQGATWDVWEVRPAAAEEALRKVRAQRNPEASDWSTGRVVSEALASGWLCFESGPQKRRLAPIPDAWLHVAPSELLQYCSLATPVTRRHTDAGATAATSAAAEAQPRS